MVRNGTKPPRHSKEEGEDCEFPSCVYSATEKATSESCDERWDVAFHLISNGTRLLREKDILCEWKNSLIMSPYVTSSAVACTVDHCVACLTCVL